MDIGAADGKRRRGEHEVFAIAERSRQAPRAIFEINRANALKTH